MADERPIEKWLRDYASRRGREAEGKAMHPASRRLLQGEVVRTYGQRRQPRFAGIGFWPVWARAVAASLGLVLAVSAAWWAMRPVDSVQKVAVLEDRSNAPAESPMQLASTDKASPASAFKEIPPAPTSATALRQLKVATNKELAAGSRPTSTVASLQEKAKSSIESAPAAAPMLDALAAKDQNQLTSAAPATGGVLSAPAATQVASRYGLQSESSAAALSTPPASPSQVMLQRFSNQAVMGGRVAMRSSTNAVVLSSFQIEQEGSKLRVVDRDGSVYVGEVSPVTTTEVPSVAVARSAARRVAQTRVEPSESNAAQYGFRVQGTNLTLKQNVVFNGTFVDQPIPVQLQNRAFSNAAAGAQFQNQLQKSRILGNAIVGGTQVPVQAVPE